MAGIKLLSFEKQQITFYFPQFQSMSQHAVEKCVACVTRSKAMQHDAQRKQGMELMQERQPLQCLGLYADI